MGNIDVMLVALGQVPEGRSAATIPEAQQGPEVQPTLDTVARLLDKLQKKDTYHIFREPVTDEVVGHRSSPLPGTVMLRKPACQSLGASVLETL